MLFIRIPQISKFKHLTTEPFNVLKFTFTNKYINHKQNYF